MEFMAQDIGIATLDARWHRLANVERSDGDLGLGASPQSVESEAVIGEGGLTESDSLTELVGRNAVLKQSTFSP
jgi:hypothetical protein